MWPFTGNTYPELKPLDIADRTFDYIIVGGGVIEFAILNSLSTDVSS